MTYIAASSDTKITFTQRKPRWYCLCGRRLRFKSRPVSELRCKCGRKFSHPSCPSWEWTWEIGQVYAL